MAFVVAKSGRFEIRESASTPRGPRATTLATFRVLDDDVLDRAADRAQGRFDRTALRARARELGAPIAPSRTFEAARVLAGELGRGHRPGPGLVALIASALAASGPSGGVELDSLDDAAEWIGVSEVRRGRALWDLLELTDALPKRRTRAPSFPRLAAFASG